MADVLHGIVVDAEMPWFACFRRPTSTSLMLTYPVPPFTTIVGMIANALGVSRPVYFESIRWLQDVLWVNLRPIVPIQRPSRELAKILKLVGEVGERRRPTSFPSSPMYKYFLVRPAFRFFLAGEDGGAINEIADSLRHPGRPLYLGQSDDMVDVRVVWQGKVIRAESHEAWAMLVGLRVSGGQFVELLRLPMGFVSERQLVYSPLLSLPGQFPFRLLSPEPMWRFDEEAVPLIAIREAMQNAVAGETGGS